MDDEYTSLTSVSVKSTDIAPISPEMIKKLVVHPPKKYYRPPNVIPFHIPHKKLLEKIEFKKKQPEPLAGFKNRIKLLRKQKLDDIERYPLRKMSRVTSLEDAFIEQSDQPVTAVRYKRRSDIEPDASFVARKISYKLAPTFARTSSSVKIVDQFELIAMIQSDPKGGFVYLVYSVPRCSEYFTPYCLKVVPYEEIDKYNFMTMSAHGVTQYRGTDVTYTALDQWTHEYTMYCKLLTIKTFRLYTEWKAFYVWRKSIVSKKYRDSQKNLNNSLFCLNTELRRTLIMIKSMCRDLEKFVFTEPAVIENWNLFYFIETQMGKVEYMKDKMINFRETIKMLLNNTCHTVLYEAGYTTDDKNYRGSMGASLGRKQKTKMSYIEQAKKKRTCVKISRFITVVDYIILGTLQTLLVRSTDEFLKIFATHFQFVPDEELLDTNDIEKQIVVERPADVPQVPLILVDLEDHPDGLRLNASKAITHDAFLNLMNLWEEITCSLTPFLADPFFKPFIQPSINNKIEDRLTGFGPTLVTVLREDTGYNDVRDEVLQLIDENYEAAHTYIQRFNPIHEFIAEDIATDHESIKNETILETFRVYMKRYHDEIETIERIVQKQPLGILSINMKNFVTYTLPEPCSLLQTCETTLPWLGKTRTDALIASVNDATAYLENDPRVTIDYVKYIEFIDRSIGILDTMEGELEYLKEMYDMMEEYRINIPPEDFNEYLGLSVIIANLRTIVDKKTEEKDKVISKFNDQISKDISALIEEVGAIKDELMQPWLIDVATNVEEATAYLQGLTDHLLECQSKATTFKNYQKMIRAEVTRFDMLNEVINDVKLRTLLWETVVDWDKTMAEWKVANFATMDPEEMSGYTMKNIKNVTKLEKGLPANAIVPKLKEDVENMKDKMPVIKTLRNPALRTRHWARFETILNYKFKPDEALTLELFEKIGAFNYPTELTEVSGQASSEAGLETMLKKVEETWKSIEFPVNFYKDTKDVFILGSTEEIQVFLDDSLITMNTINSSRYVGPIKSRVDEMARQLDVFQRTLEEWQICQKNWLYLEVIFSAPDIQRQLPQESKMFMTVDKTWKEIMRRTAKVPLALPACLVPGTLTTFQKNNALLEQVMKCLEAYLETKRVAFPRFYFLSNDELLEILAQTKNPHAVQPHLRKCFDAIAKLEFGVKNVEVTHDEESPTGRKSTIVERIESRRPSGDVETIQVMTTDIVAMISPENERVKLEKGLKARGNVEDWLGKVEESMFTSLKRAMEKSIKDYEQRERTDWVKLHPNQIVLTASQIMWAQGVHAVFESDNVAVNLVEYEKKCTKDLNDLATLVRMDLTPVLRKILIALITVDVHAKNTITVMVSNGVLSSNNFDWLKMLRYYWDKEIENCVAKMSSASYIYGYEYLGAGGCLVITPLTDRCYLCLMGALQLDLGGAPAGPAGTGKTETTKDLAKGLAIQCVVFNCSEGLDFRMMGRFFSGLAQSGAWCCFDEFNRIDIEVLSVIAQQLITIRNAKAARATRFMFEGREIKLVRSCAAFITMNPGYAGRTELPDNLKALFRPISMMVPDYALIAEVTLYSEGFVSSQVLAQKMVQMYKLCSEQLSLQDHYDFGMRAVKSVLVMAGTLKRANPDTSENVVLIRALRDSNLPKFLSDDAILFQGILGDLFPGIILPEQDYGDLQNAIEASMEVLGLQKEACQIRKVLQLYETMIVRWGVMLVGPTGGGKTTVLNILEKALTKLYNDGIDEPFFRPVHKYILNPKSVTLGELYGEVNSFSLEWRDGLLGMMVRTAVQCTKDDHQWVTCDGPVDAVWIENLNTVLDDNKMLCLANSERIKLTPYVHMLFEVQDLSQASPATVSRCGMVYIDAEELKWMPYVKTWIAKFPDEFLHEDLKHFVVDLFAQYVEDAFIFISKRCEQVIHQVDVSKAAMMCALIESFLLEPLALDKNMDRKRIQATLCQAFLFALLWCLGGNLSDATRNLYEVHIRETFTEHPLISFPNVPDMWSAYVNVTARGFETWARIMPDFEYDPELPFFDLIVPTLDTLRFGYIMEKLIAVNYPVMVTGGTGVGKSIIAKSVLNKLVSLETFVPITLNFSAQTSSTRTQEILELKLEKRRKTLLGAPFGKKMVVFVDDVNMPKLEKYGAQPPIELLRQYLDFGGFYDRGKLFWKDIVDVILMCACAPPGGGRNPLTPRFVRHFGMLAIPEPTESSMKTIFKAIMTGFLDDFSEQVRALGVPMVNAAVEIYERIALDLLPTPTKSHYVFNLRDLSKCIQGVLQSDSGTMRDSPSMLRLFYHECLRVFHDRLVTVEDKTYFYRLLRDICQRNFQTPVLELPDTPVILAPPLLLFGDFMAVGSEKIYEEIKDLDKLKSVLHDFLEDYSMVTSKEMKLIFFMDAVEHCTRLARILRSERGNALLVGVSGMGKQSLTKLASHINDAKCFQVELTRQYDHVSFFDDLRRMYQSAGFRFENTVFLFTDDQIIQEEFLEDVNNILNSGEVPNLFESDEYEKMITAMVEPAKEAGLNESNRDAIYDLFIKRVRAKLHLSLCMSPVGDAFRRRCRMFPSLVNCCTIDWFDKWPREALMSVAVNSLEGIGEEGLAPKLASFCVTVHESVESMTVRFFNEMRRHYYTTPSSYLELLKLYKIMLDRKRDRIIASRDRIANGVTKLHETNLLIRNMREDLIAMRPALTAKSKAVSELLVTLAKEQDQADQVRTVVKLDEASAQEKAAETQVLADEAQKDLESAMPALEAARIALEALNKSDINELRVFQKPPKLVQFVMESVCLLLGSKLDWASAKQVLGDVNFLKRLKEYDKDHVSDIMLRKLKVYMDNKDFVPDVVATTSKVCKSMCMWVRAIDSYSKVFRVVEPKIKKKQEAEREFEKVMAVLREKQKTLAEVEAMIASLEASYEASVAEMQELQDTIALIEARLGRAGKLTDALGDEQERWERSIEEFDRELVNVVGDVITAAACVAYLGAFTSVYREELVVMWTEKCHSLGIPCSETFSLIKVLADPYEIRLWNTWGLPKDNMSTENGILVTQAGRWPLMIDPQEQANRWIRQMENANGLKIIKLTNSNFMRILEAGIRVGLPILLEEVGETIDPTLGPILTKQTFMQGGRLMIRLGDSDVEYDSNFRFYVTTKLSNPHYLPTVCILVTLVNFTVTPSGLEDQLLADVVRLERPDLEQMRSELITRINNDKMQLKNIEDKILKMLQTSQGNILDDEELIDTLNESKETSGIIAARLMETEMTEEKISIAREKYRTVATRGSVLYFVVADLAQIDPMYQYSLKYFKQIFNNVIEISEKCAVLETRLELLLKEITLAVYTNVSRGLFERHKLVFSFLLCISIMRESGLIHDGQWNFILRGPVGAKITKKKPDVMLLSDNMWLSTLFLEQNFPSFANLTNDCVKRIDLVLGDFVQMIDLSGKKEPPAVDWNSKLQDFEKLMLMKALKEEKLVFAITEFVKLNLGQKFIESPQISLHLLYQDTSNVTPLIFVLSTGSDPFSAFQRFAADMQCTEKIQSISLGQGQGPVAEKMIMAGKERGDWVFLQNCHLATSWMLPMENLILRLAEEPDKVHNEFRMFMSSMPSKAFPVSVLQNSVKVTNEPPKGLKANLKRAFGEIEEDFFENHPLGDNWRKIIFGICFFHAVIQERKKFGPLGWNISYEFNDSDRECALNTIKMFCEMGFIPWDALDYITGEITYGGRVTDYWDLRCLKTILQLFFSAPTLEKGYVYSTSGTYYCPVCPLLEEYRGYIDLLPMIEEPEIFGMHENANIAFQTKETQSVLVTILESQPRSAVATEGKSSDEIVFELSQMVMDVIKKKVHCENPYKELLTRDEKGRLPSLSTVLLQEIDRFNKLLKLIHASMINLQKAIKGLVVMSEDLEAVFLAFINNQVPGMWNSKAYPSLKSLGSWINDLVLRLDFISTWLANGPPVSYWISGFFFQQGFLTGTLQTHARKYDLPIDTLKFDFTVLDPKIDQEEIKRIHDNSSKENLSIYGKLQRPTDGVIVHGLFFDAGLWDPRQKLLVDPKPGELNPVLPALLLEPKTTMPDPDPRYICPLYKTSVRAGTLSTTGHSTNFVMAVLLPAKSQNFWILRGTALLTQITD